MKWVFWIAEAAIGYAYVGYPLWLWLRSRWSPRPVRRGGVEPAVSVLMVVRNEEAVIGRKLENLLALDSGCLWGGCLTAVRLEDRRVFQLPCSRQVEPHGWE